MGNEVSRDDSEGWVGILFSFEVIANIEGVCFFFYL